MLLRARIAPFVIVALLLAYANAFAETKQEQVHRMSHEVMPFAMDKTVHVFRMTEFGGVLKVLARDQDASDQIELVRRHLTHEAMRFRQGDFGDPETLHGTEMPGLPELRANHERIEVSYRKLPAGAEITFRTEDLTTLTAIHRWFGAQLSEHGADARAE